MTKLVNLFKQIYRFITHDVWRITENELSRGKRIPYRLVKVIIISLRGLSRDKLTVRASALTYSIIFAIVPLFALFIAVGKGFGVEYLIRNWLEKVLIAQRESIPIIMDFVERYLESAHGGLFIGIGIVILLTSAMNFFKQAEEAFNSIWEVKKSRSFIRQFTAYFSALFLIPILVVLMSGINIYFNNLIVKLQSIYMLSPILKFGMKLAPYLISWIVFTAIYIVIPNTRVKFKSAMIAGIIAGSSYHFFQTLYISGQVYLSRYNVVYGSFAAVPLLLLWLQTSCMIVLLGAEISYASQNLQNYEYEGDSNNISIRYKKFLSVFLTYVIVKRFENNLSPLRNDEIASIYKLPIRLTNQLLTELSETGIIIEILDDNLRTKSYQPGVDINQLTIKMLTEKIETKGSELFLSNKNPELDDFWLKHLDLVQTYMNDEMQNLLVKDI